MGANSQALTDFPIFHGGLKKVPHLRLGVEVDGETAIRYMRFLRPVRVDRLELPRSVYGRWVPSVPTHPAHLIISVMDRQTYRWKTVGEVDLPPDPKVSGEGLSQSMRIEEMERRLKKALKEPAHIIDMGGIRTDHLRVECDREYPVWPSHGEVAGPPHTVPFGILHPLVAFGRTQGAEPIRTPYRPILRRGTIKPSAPRGMRVRDLAGTLRFEGKRLSVGFSVARPMLTHLGLDALGGGAAAGNRLAFRRSHGAPAPRGLSGPFLSGLSMDFGADLWTGEVSARGNRVSYRHLQAVEGLKLDAVFTVEPDRLVIELRQSCEADMPVLDAGAWRLVWDLTAGITGAAGVPTLLPGRNGDVAWPALWATDGAGCLSCRLLDGDPDHTRLQVESHRAQNVVTGAFVMAPRPLPDGCLVLPAGTRKATVELAAALLEPERRQKRAALHAGIRRHWGTVFSCFRPEYRGFSNHSASCNCHVSQAVPTEIVAHTRRPKIGPDPLALARFTIGRALLDGGGYGYWRNLYLDSDPNLVCAAGRIHQAEPDAGWLRRIEPGLVETIERMAGTLGREGLVICRDLSGDSGSFRWSTNSMDVIGFGHMDAYVNAWTYRAFRNAAALLDELGRDALADQCREWAQDLEAAYAPALVNPKTGWIAGWRSRDGKLHDSAFMWVNGPAIAFGLLDRGAARKALAGLERLRARVCPISERLGLPLNLMPISVEDHMLPRVLGGTQPTFESYTDGSLSGWPATYYLRALSIYGFKRHARRIATAMAEGYAAGVFSGGNGTGSEFRTWDGTPTGYEGTLIGCFGPMYSIAIEIGGLVPRSPEWWPAGG